MAEKLLTVSIAAYNVADTLKTAVDSLIADEETLRMLDVIIVNDGSKDDTSRIAHAYADRYPDSVTVIDKPNGGYGSTVNASLAAAKGKYFKLLDGDDWYVTENLPGFLQFLRDASADLILSPYNEVRETPKRIDTHAEIGQNTVNLADAAWQNDVLLMHEVAVKTDALRRTGYQIAEHCFYTDIEFVFYAAAASGTVSRYAKPVYCYRLGVEGQSVSVQGIRRHYADYPVVARRIFGCYQTMVATLRGGKKQILDAIVRNYTYHTYHAFLVLERPMEKRGDLMALDREFRSRYPDAYRLGFNSHLVKWLRKSRFLLYGLLWKMKV